MDSLTKENFWKRLEASHPAELDTFRKWIDAYKEKINWRRLFNFGSPHYAKMGWHDPKFHDLPVAMQIGVFIQYISESKLKGAFDFSKISKALTGLDAEGIILAFFELEKINKEPVVKLTSAEQSFFKFVKQKHGEQKRKYTGVPYYFHLLDVAKIVQEYIDDPCAVSIALGHDTVEDTDCTFEELNIELSKHFPAQMAERIVGGIKDLTDVYTREAYPTDRRAVRKQWEVERLAKVGPLSQSIKCADLYDNGRTILKMDPDFAKTYLEEKGALLKVLTKALPELRELASSAVN